MIIATHDGPFHADDVFGCALLLELFSEANVMRSRDLKKLKTADIVFDVGGVQDPVSRRFDHHMLNAERRENGIIYSAFGLLWREYGLRFCDMNEEVWLKIDHDFVMSIDADDNGQIIESSNEYKTERVKIDSLVRMFNPLNEETFNDQFMVVVAIARQILLRLKLTTLKYIAMRQAVLDEYAVSNDKSILLLNRYVPIHELRNMPEKLVHIVCKEKEDRWLVCGVQDTNMFDSLRLSFPNEWRGLSGEAFEAATQLKDVQSCHRNGFVAVADTQEAALNLGYLSLKSSGAHQRR